MMAVLLWICVGLVLYCYFGYPVLIALWARLFYRPVRKGEYVPSVSVVMAVWNEQDVIERKLNNLLSLRYPAEKIEFVIGSDGSTDRTGELVGRFQDPRLKYTGFLQRRGKMLTLNDLMAQASGEIVVFADARQIFAPDAVSELAQNFADAQVGCVSGELIFDRPSGGTAKGINVYWEYEKFIRDQESRVHSMLGATGAIYAIRRALFEPVPSGVILDDMYTPLRIIAKGYRAVFDGAAKAFDRVAEDAQEEYRRKTRTISGNYQIFTLLPEMFVPFRSPVAFQLFSHKFLRVLVPFLLIFILMANLFLLPGPFWTPFFLLQLGFYACAALGHLVKGKRGGGWRMTARLTYVPYVFCLLNFSALIGFFRYISARQEVRWEKARVSQ